jgi:hypothetical protein
MTALNRQSRTTVATTRRASRPADVPSRSALVYNARQACNDSLMRRWCIFGGRGRTPISTALTVTACGVRSSSSRVRKYLQLMLQFGTEQSWPCHSFV